jgi:regulation of enolase protein 1 (concanavalin A-like superfamily)
MRSKIALASGHLLVLVSLLLITSTASAAEYTASDVGGGSDGALVAVPGGYDLSSRSRDLGGTADQFHFGFEKRAGNFDVQVRLEGVTITDAFVHAGLMARSSTDVGSPFAAMFASSALLGTFFESRATTNGSSAQIAPRVVFPVNYPQMYLRLKRSGSAFTGYASFDGTAWQQVGNATVNMPSEVLLGISVSSLNTNAVSTARFRDIKDVTNPTSYTYKPVETLGPSNRRTGITFSEIMYHPSPRSDAEDVEFIEIFNAESVFIDFTGWRLSGAVDYKFPDGFRLESGQFAVIAENPDSIQRVYGYAGALGPYQGHLDAKGETLRLLNRAGAIRLEVGYQSDAPWPVAADGAGHSMVLARPSYGEDDPRAWAASDRVGGSPGDVDARWPNPWRSIVINEILANSGNPFVELYNASVESVDLSGCILTDDVTTNRFRIPTGTFLPARGFIGFTQSELNFALRASGNTLYLLSPTNDRVIDVIRYTGQEKDVSLGRAPDGSPRITRLASPTASAANATRRVEDVVINELMYHSVTGKDADSYVELHNPSANEVDVSGWKLIDGIDYKIPESKKIAPGGFLVIANDAAHLISIYPQLNTDNTLGDFDGKLSHNGEHIALAKRDFATTTNSLGGVTTNAVYVTVGEVTYVNAGRWSELADGGGSSLELTDPRSDTTLAGNWAASDETQKAPWTTVDVTSRVELGGGANPANRLQIIMQGAGECLVDDIELIPSGSTNILVNGAFEDANTTWRFFGNHSKSAFESSAAFSGQNGLHVRAPGDGDTANNAIRGNLVRNLPTSGTATLRAKVRWVSGWPEVLFRVRGNWMEVPARMDVPKQLGTPGLANSRRVPNAPPVIYDITHSPALPRANEAVVVTCRVSDPDGIAAPQLRYRIDPNQTLSTVAMHDDGINGDELAGDGIYSATIPGQAARSRLAFQIRASDDSATAATSIFPPDAPARECLIVWDEVVPFGTFAHYHMWNTAATDAARGGPDLDNTFRDATLVYGNARVIYNVGFRDKGSPYHNGGGDFAVTVPGDEKLLGIDDRIFASTGNGGDEGTQMKGDVAGWVAEQMGIPFLHSHFMRLYRNASGTPFRAVSYDMEQPNRYFAKSWYNGGGVKDDLFKIAIWFEFDDGNSGFNSTGATLQNFISNGQYKLARYRWNWQLRPSIETANDYTAIFRLAAAANSSSDRTRVLPYLADMEEWMRVFGYHRVTGNWDSYTYNVGQNMFLYAPLGQPATMLPWDIDFVLGEGDGTSAATLFTSGTDSVLQQIFNLPMYKRMLWRAYQDAVNGPLVAAKFQPQVDARRNALRKNNVNAASPTSITSYMNGRRSYIAGQLTRADASTFAITSNGGDDFTSANNSVSLTGVAPFAVASIEVNGVPYAINWTGATNWQISVPLGGVTNVLQIAGRDLRGQALTSAVDTITIVYNGPVPLPRDWVVINEINYHSLASKADFVELYNRHPSFAFDLSGFRLDGIDYDFPSGTLIQPNGYLVVVEHRASFAAAYDPLLPILGPYSGNLQNDGETLRLIQPGATAADDVIIDEVRYSDSPPWPAAADGFGPSLQLIDATQDNWRAGNWATTVVGDPNQATPGKPNSIRSTLDPFPKLWINEIQPNNISGITDSQGEHEPWIELFNAESSPLDLSTFYLSDDATNLTKWQFPAGASIGAGEFLVVWADGQTSQSSATALHTNFRLAPTNGVVLLSRIQGIGPAVADYATYQVTTPENSYGSYPDGDPRHRRRLFVPTPGAPNSPLIPNVTVAINEWMAATQSIIRDPADGQFQNWFELYNYGTNVVDLSGFYFTHTESDPTMFQIPLGYRLNPGEFRLVWADAQPEQNAQTNDLHVNFTLDADGDQIALYTPDEQLVRLVTFGEQTANISEGLFPDGSESQSAAFITATPGAPNVGQFANRPPAITPVAKQTVDEGQNLSFKIVATDSDVPAQTLSYSIKTGPPGATIDAQSAMFSWTPTEDQGPGSYLVTVQVKDNGTPVQSANVTFNITVHESNAAPSIAPIVDQTIDEGLPFSLAISAQDSDIPAQKVSLSLVTPPVGASLDSVSGEFQWTPSEDQGPGTYTITVQATDDGQPAASSTRSFKITVRDINNAPIIADIPIQTASENVPFSLQIQAQDPDNPPAQLTYVLENAPAGMVIDQNTGLISWIPGEADAPHDYNVTVHVNEPGGVPSTTTTFLIGAKEVNLAPTIEPVTDIVAQPGDLISVPIHAADADLPVQGLTFTAIGGLPPGASLSGAGVVTWPVQQDPPVGTNRITIRVSDDFTPALIAQTSFNVIIRAPLRVAINEIMHRPATPNAEFIELANYSSVTAADLSGWRLEGYDYTFPAGTVLSPGAFLCVARDVTAFRTAYGTNGVALGNASITVAANGGVLRLIKPGQPGFPDEVIDETLFSLAPPWPSAAASQGASLQLIDPWEDHRRVNNWSASAASVTNIPISVLPMNATWKYWQNEASPGVSWTSPGFNDTAWPSGGALLYVEGDSLPAPKITPLTLGRITYYFRTHFNFNGNPDGATLRLNTIIDDGAVFYLNGQEVYRLAMPAGTILQSTLASRSVGNAAVEGPFDVPATGLRSGDSVLAVEVHQTAAGSSDIVLGASLDVIAVKSVSFTPNAPNSVTQDWTISRPSGSTKSRRTILLA